MTQLKITEPVVSIEWLSANVDHPDLIILDASLKKPNAEDSKNEYANIRIKNARFFDIENSFSEISGPLPHMMPTPELFSAEAQKLGIKQNSVIVVYDNHGMYSSPRAWWMFRAMGHENVAVLNGGLPSWRKANLACEPARQMPVPHGNFKASYQPALISDLEQVSVAMHDPGTLILDARSEGRFTGSTPEPRAGLRGGHIPNSINLPFEKVVKEGEMLPEDDLKEMFANLHVKNEKLIFTCGSGVTACIIALAAERAGLHQKSIYDGSWSEWGKLPDLPIEC
ncbi:MAG: 3-mercaptopyruvate sulfurtransferase [Cytophagales bacterium]|nr:3-mercaptopyruvate sulfurtransferase [Cytophagales bacterium]